MNRIIVIISCFMIFTCSCQNDCHVDKEFQSKFENCLLLVRKINSPYVEADFRNRAYTYECLYAITGHEGFVDKDNEPHYFYPYSDTFDYIEYDLKVWNEWYESNKCTMTLSKADSLIHIRSIECGDSINWPISVDKLVIVEF